MNNILSRGVDTKKIFIVWYFDITGNRFDPSFYRESFCFKSKIYKSYELSECAYINPNTSFSRLDKNSEISFVPMDAINEEDGMIEKRYYKKVSDCIGYTRFKENDLIWAKITPCMQNGNSAIVRNAKQGYAFGSTEFFVIRPKTDKLLVEYIYILLRDKRVLNDAMNYFGGSAGQQRVSKDFLMKFKFPLPPVVIQKKIVGIYELANQKKQKKETAAEKLLASIDEYLLGELDISLPKKDSSLKNRIFTVQFSEITEGRICPFLIYNKKYRVEGGIYKNYKLKEVAQLSKGQSITSEEIVEGDYPVIAGGQTSPYSHNTCNYKGNVITISASGAYSGYVWYHAYPIFASDCIVIQAKNVINSIFLAEVLKIKQQEIYSLQQGAGQPHVYIKDLEKLFVPLPPIKKQKQIADYIKKIRTKAKSLQEEAQNIFEQAKNEVEQVILGNIILGKEKVPINENRNKRNP